MTRIFDKIGRTAGAVLLIFALLASLQIITTVSCTKSAAPEWISLFNGADLEGWIVPESGNWTVEDGELTTSWSEEKPGGSWIMTEETYDDFVLKLKFWVNEGGNSGVAIRVPEDGKATPASSGYEIQIDHNNPHNPTGSIYALARAYTESGFGPTAKPYSKEEEWNDMEISAIGDHITVHVNGQKVVERFDRRSLKGSIGLQLHDEKSNLRFKDIQIKTLPAKRPLGPSMEEQLTGAPGEFKTLFNGKNLDGWQIMWGGEWTVDNGTIIGTIEDGMGWLLTNDDYSDFIFRLNIKIAMGGNGGLTVRFPMPEDISGLTWKIIETDHSKDPAYGGYEIQVLDYRLPQVGNDAGSIYNISRSPASVLLPDEWNLYEVYALGDHMAVYINGKKVAEAIDDRSLKGVVGLQVHYLEGEHEIFGIEIDPYKVEFKDIEIKAVN